MRRFLLTVEIRVVGRDNPAPGAPPLSADVYEALTPNPSVSALLTHGGSASAQVLSLDETTPHVLGSDMRHERGPQREDEGGPR